MLQVDFLTLCIVIFLNSLTVSMMWAGVDLLGFPSPRRFGRRLWDADYPDRRAQAFGNSGLGWGQ
jgi:hypothetical protein